MEDRTHGMAYFFRKTRCDFRGLNVEPSIRAGTQTTEAISITVGRK